MEHKELGSVSDSPRLDDSYPDLCEEWHPVRNGDAKPSDYTSGSGKKVWWLCQKSECEHPHEWQAVIGSRTKQGVGCPFCSGRRVCPCNSLATLYPNVAKLKHPEENIDLSTVSPQTNKKIRWKCPNGPDHEWIVAPSGLTHRGGSCPFCSGKRVSVTNSLANVKPILAAEWHPTKNGEITPNDVTFGSNKKIWWKCPNGPDHEWETPISARIREKGGGCPFCSEPARYVSITNCLETVRPDIAELWHPTKNGSLTPREIVAGSNKRFWFKCPNGSDHEWQPKLTNLVTLNRGCPFCSNNRVSVTNSLSNLFPEIANQWHPMKNGDLKPDKIVSGLANPVWWKCPKGPDHEWRQSPSVRTTQDVGCPYCSGHRVSVTNSLATLFPELSNELHPTLNGKSTANDIVAFSGKKVWWICENGPDHVWDQSPAVRAGQGVGCPQCHGLRVSVTNSFATKRPDKVVLWHPNKNGELTPDNIVARSNKKYWWRCELFDDHEWETSPNSLSGCPICHPGGFNEELPGYYYSMKIHNENETWWWKGGISHDPERRRKEIEYSLRSSGMHLDVEIIETLYSEKGHEIRELETKLLQEKKIRIKCLEKFSGSSELFSVNPIAYAREKEWIAKRVFE